MIHAQKLAANRSNANETDHYIVHGDSVNSVCVGRGTGMVRKRAADKP